MMRYVFVLLGSCLVSPWAWSGYGTFSYVKGKAFVAEEGRRAKRVRRGLKIQPGQNLRTEDETYLKITMNDGNLIHVGPKTEMVLATYVAQGEGPPESTISVLYGKVRTELEQKYNGKDSFFRVTTDAAVLGVRGTDFLTEHNGEAALTRVTTFGGLVRVAGKGPGQEELGPKTLGAGEMTLVTLGEAPLAPVELPDDLINSIQRESIQARGRFSFEESAKADLGRSLKALPSEALIPENHSRPPRGAEPRQLIERNVINNGGRDSGSDNTSNESTTTIGIIDNT